MADFASSVLVAGQALFNDKFNSGEWRMPDFAAVSVAKSGAIANPNLQELRTAESRAVNAYFPIRQAAINGTARAHDHTGAIGDSLAETITWNTFSEPFSISIKQADNNVLNFATMFASTQRNAVFNLMNRIDAAFVTSLIADKTQFAVDGGNMVFEGTTTDDGQLAAAEKDFYFQNVKAYLEQNLYLGNLTGIVDTFANVLAGKLAAQGPSNDENTQFQFAGYDNIVSTTRSILAVPATYSASGLFFETGLVGVVPWIPRVNRKPLNEEKAASFNGDWGSIPMPGMPGVDIAVHAYGTRADTSGGAGETQDLVIQYELSVDVGFVNAPLSTFRGASDSVVYSAGILVP